MSIIVACVLLYFFAVPLIGGAIAFLTGDVKADFSEAGKTERVPLFNPFYKKSPFNLS